MKNAIAIRHVAFEDLGTLATVLHKRDHAITYLEASPGFLDGIDPLVPDLVIILGGPIGAYDERDYPFLTDELRLLEKRLTADLPTLGICLGAQLMARSLGAKVYPGSEKEIGWSSIALSQAGLRSPLSHLAPDYTVLHWHGDTFDLPLDSIHLAASSKYENQAFAWRKCGLALQFHPEVTARTLERWFIGHACEIDKTPGINVTELRQNTALYGERLETQAAKIWHEWLSQFDNEP
jgi:GMP synthase (glutamine-hydrolysing)